jgi:iron complex transport system substrate-binding protein
MIRFFDNSTTRAVFAAVAVSLAFPAAAAVAQEISITHAQGETTLPERPAKVLALDLSVLDTLDALGVQVAGVPSGAKPAYLAKYAGDDVPKVGTFFEPDYEAINAAEPDLIIVAGRSGPKYAELARIAPTIDLTVDPADFMASSRKNVRTLAKLFGKESEGQALIARLESSTAALKEKASVAGKGLMLMTTGGKMSTYGPGSRFDLLFSEYGVQPADDKIAVANHGQPVSFEYLLQHNPDWLFVLDRDAAIGQEGQTAQKLLDNEIVAKTNAWKNGHVVYLDGASWYLASSGITALQNNIDQLSKAFDKN